TSCPAKRSLPTRLTSPQQDSTRLCTARATGTSRQTSGSTPPTSSTLHASTPTSPRTSSHRPCRKRRIVNTFDQADWSTTDDYHRTHHATDGGRGSRA